MSIFKYLSISALQLAFQGEPPCFPDHTDAGAESIHHARGNQSINQSSWRAWVRPANAESWGAAADAGKLSGLSFAALGARKETRLDPVFAA
ncbi:hypothetical protein ACVBEH_14590 [Roseateles sp. GG27B]